MASEAFSAKGTILAIGSDPIAEIKSIRGPSESAQLLEVTSHDSEGNYREVIAGFLSGGEIAIEGNFIPGDTDGQVALHDALQDRGLDSYTLTVPSTPETIFTFDGIVTAFETSFPFDDVASFSATITISGPVEWSSGT